MFSFVIDGLIACIVGKNLFRKTAWAIAKNKAPPSYWKNNVNVVPIGRGITQLNKGLNSDNRSLKLVFIVDVF